MSVGFSLEEQLKTKMEMMSREEEDQRGETSFVIFISSSLPAGDFFFFFLSLITSHQTHLNQPSVITPGGIH